MLARILGLVALILAVPAVAADEAYPKGQLPTGVTPTHYTLDMTILPDQQGFSGTATIDVTVDKPAAVIWLHGRELSVQEAKITDAAGTTQTATWAEIPKSDGVAKLTVAKPVSGKIKLAIRYSAQFNRELEGLYRSDEDGQAYAYTQMEPIDARRAFPSFDEPRFKTPYDIALTVRAAHTAVSNTPVIKETPVQGGLKRIQFATSKPLPTYLIAMAVGPFDVVTWDPIPKTAIRDRVVPLRGITVKGKGPQIRYALANTAGLLTKLEEYFGIPYPFEKLDLIAALDFSAGAMENAGAIVYREPLMLFEDNAALSIKRRYALVHAHEMSHQWFGDLVTPAWWNDIWLNESFATWMEHKTTTAWDPKGEFDRGGLQDALGVMSQDAKKNARRIAQPIESMDDIQNAFDGITYEKGNAVLLMFEHYYGVENFRKGVQLHLQRHASGNATANDFFASIADANHDEKGVAAFRSFIDQAGVPVVQTALDCTNGPQVSLSQSRYVEAGAGAPPQQTWKIPMCITSGDASGRSETCALFEEKSGKIPLKAKSCPAWVMPNSDGAGYYRFALDKKGWDALVAAAPQLNDREVLTVLSNLGAAFDAGQMDIGDYMDRVKGMIAKRPVTWDIAGSIGGALASVKDSVAPPDVKDGVERFIRELYEPLYAKVGLEANTALDKENPVQATLLRTPVVNMVAVQGKLPAAREELRKRGAAYLGLKPDGSPGDGKIHADAIDPNIADSAVVVAIQDLGPKAADAAINLLKTERNAVVRGRLMGALTRSTDPAVAAKTRDLLLTGNLRVNEVPIVTGGAMRERANVESGWQWFKQNFEAIKKKTPEGGRGGLVGVGGRFCTPQQRDDYKAFFGPKVDDLEGGPREFAQTLESIDTCIAIAEKQAPKARTYFGKAGS